MPRPFLPLLLCTSLALSPAWAGFGRKRAKVGEPTEPREHVHEEGGTKGLLDDPLPVDPGRLPRGLANLSAQGCAACHYEAADAWAAGPHATGFDSEAFRETVADAGTPACLGCHLPVVQQHVDLVTYDGSADAAVRTPNPSWSPTLAGEGVTCAACHARAGRVLAARAVDGAPHATVWSADLASPQLCARCHQGGWEDADAPLYDTYGEWERSPYAEAGVTCIDCHGHGAAGHDVSVRRGRGASVLIELPAAEVRRGARLEGAIRVQNTGAGHAFPTGTPWRGVRISAALHGPDDARIPVLTEDLARVIEPQRPYRVTADTRVPAAGERRLPLTIGLPSEAPAGLYTLVVEGGATLRGEAIGAPFFVRRIPLSVR